MRVDAQRAVSPHQRETRSGRSSAVRFFVNFMELQIPMVLGALVCYLLGRLVTDTSAFATVYFPGSYLFTIGDALFLSIPVVGWMVLRSHSWQCSLQMAVAMIAPLAAIGVVGQLAGFPYLLWLLTAGYPAMSLGMLAYMLWRRDHFTRPFAVAASTD